MLSKGFLFRILACVTAACAALAWGSRLVADDPLRNPPAPAMRANPGEPTESHCREWGLALQSAVRKGDLGRFNELVDWDALLSTTTGIANPSPKLAASRADFVRGALIALRGDSSGFGAQIAAETKLGSYTLLRVQLVDGRRRALFRMITKAGALNYHGYLFDPAHTAPLRAVDCYVFLTGEPLTKTMRRNFLPLVALDRSGIEHLTEGDKEFLSHLSEFGDLARLTHEKRFQEALNVYKHLPRSLQKSKTILSLRLQAAQSVSEDEYLQAIDDFRREYPHDAMIDLISLDGYVLRKEFNKAFDAIDRIDKAVGGDPYLKTLRAVFLSLQGKTSAARKFAEQAISEEPTLVNAHFFLITLSLKSRDFATTLKELKTLESKFGVKFKDLTAVPSYSEFVKSPEYRTWLASHPR
jgi:hypothetical protein